MEALHFILEYAWEPFTVSGHQLTFEQLAGRRLVPNECSHHRNVVFKWTGLVTRVSDEGHAGQLGILFGQADDIAARIQEYATAKVGAIDYEYREGFLLSGDIRLFILRPGRVTFGDKEPKMPFPSLAEYWIAKQRGALVDLLMLDSYAHRLPFAWIVNRGFQH